MIQTDSQIVKSKEAWVGQSGIVGICAERFRFQNTLHGSKTTSSLLKHYSPFGVPVVLEANLVEALAEALVEAIVHLRGLQTISTQRNDFDKISDIVLSPQQHTKMHDMHEQCWREYHRKRVSVDRDVNRDNHHALSE